MELKNAPALNLARELREIWDADIECALNEARELLNTYAEFDGIEDDDSREYQLHKGRLALLSAGIEKIEALANEYEFAVDLIADADADKIDVEEGEAYILGRLEEYEDTGTFVQ